jgi:hypothetical protein
MQDYVSTEVLEHVVSCRASFMRSSSSPSGSSCSQHRAKAAAYSKVYCSHCGYVCAHVRMMCTRVSSFQPMLPHNAYLVSIAHLAT